MTSTCPWFALLLLSWPVESGMPLLSWRHSDRPPIESVPTKIVLLYDNSNSQNLVLYARPSNLRLVDPLKTRNDVIRAISANLDAQTDVRVASFGERILMSPRWVRTGDDIRRAFDDVTQDGGPSPIWDGVYKVVEALVATPGRRVVLLISDAKASANIHGFAETLEYAQRGEVMVSAIVVVPRRSATLKANLPGEPAERLKRLADATGGRYAERPGQELPAICAEFVRALSAIR